MIGLGSRDACAEEALQQRSRGLPGRSPQRRVKTVVSRRSQGRLFEQQRNPVGKEKAQSKFKRKTRWPHNLQEIKTIGNWKWCCDIFGSIGNTELILKSRTAGCSAGYMQEYRKINLTLLKFLHLKTNRGETRVPHFSGGSSWTKGVVLQVEKLAPFKWCETYGCFQK